MSDQPYAASQPVTLIDSSAVTGRGGRERNEDSFAREELSGRALWVVADGLGGHEAGGVASRVAVDAITRTFQGSSEAVGQDLLLGCMTAAEEAIAAEQALSPTLRSMRTTAVLAVTDYSVVQWAHLGDSRLYLFRERGIIAQTQDHSVPQALAGRARSAQTRFGIMKIAVVCYACLERVTFDRPSLQLFPSRKTTHCSSVLMGSGARARAGDGG